MLPVLYDTCLKKTRLTTSRYIEDQRNRGKHRRGMMSLKYSPRRFYEVTLSRLHSDSPKACWNISLRAKTGNIHSGEVVGAPKHPSWSFAKNEPMQWRLTGKPVGFSGAVWFHTFHIHFDQKLKITWDLVGGHSWDESSMIRVLWRRLKQVSKKSEQSWRKNSARQH